jgi:nucleoside-diphosphate-sugar epimerase
LSVKKNILLTGATGFVGREFLVANEGIIKHLVVRKKEVNINLKQFLISELERPVTNKCIFEGIEVVVHLAGLAHGTFNSREYQTVNVDGCRTIAIAAAKAKVKRFVFISSIAVYGSSSFTKPLLETSKVNPATLQAKAQSEIERELHVIEKNYGIEIVIIRSSLVYGVDAPGNIYKLNKIVKALPILPFGLFINRMALISVNDLCDFIKVCAQHPNAKGIFNISDRSPASIKDITNILAKYHDKKILQIPIPILVMRVIAKLFNRLNQFTQLTQYKEINCDRANEILNWQAKDTLSGYFIKKKLVKVELPK